ncbi:HD domain-containing phosphohydrolase [candidate division CSSED10-310 bacterium]|uniref:HD domain-containing phosphohydrolase n=1 Tax=candidate division CSSED10-310 bacterium TaxID=2855610 RepID=A0ABV6Z0N6_UNCC1
MEENKDTKHQTQPLVKKVSPTLEVLVRGQSREKKIINRKIFNLGRGPENDLNIDFISVSRKHAQIIQEDNSYFIIDVGSNFGTAVNDEPVTKRRLQDRDRINLGNLPDIEIVFHSKPLPARPREAVPRPERSETETFYLPFSEQTFKKLNLLLHASQATQLTLNLKEILHEIVKSVLKVSGADRGYVLLKDDRGDLAFKVARFRSGLGKDASADISWGVVNNVIETGESKVVGDIQSDQELRKHDSIISLKLQSIMCIPLKRTHIMEDSGETQTTAAEKIDSIIGVIYVDSRGGNKIYTYDDVKILETLAGHASVAISNARLFQKEKHKSRQLSLAYANTVRVLANAIEARDIYTRGHAERVAATAALFAQELNWSPEQIYYLKIGAYLHDIGKIGVPDSILNKKGTLTKDEYTVMKQHPLIGEKIIKGMDFIEKVIPYLIYHHERFDGSGYPFSLQGNKIPIEARLLAVADVFDALTSDRPYRGPLPIDEAHRKIAKQVSKDFDPLIIEVFSSCFINDKILKVLRNVETETLLDFTQVDLSR